VKKKLSAVLLHKPVLLEEAVQSLNLKSGSVVLDGTLGSGGHSREFLKAIGEKGILVGLDQDPEAIERCRKCFGDLPQLRLHQGNFRNSDVILDLLKIPSLDAALLDVGFSSDQLEDSERGFSFERQGPLDMRMDRLKPVTAADLVRDLSQVDLEHLFVRFGEERWARRFAEKICQKRQEKPIMTTDDLVKVLDAALPRAYSYPRGKRPSWARHHPATRVFQALRIAVNDELESLSEALPKIFNRLNPGGRFSVISFHSLEDRIVKHQFKAWAQSKQGALVNKKPIEASDEEVDANPRSRSAKLRTIERL